MKLMLIEDNTTLQTRLQRSFERRDVQEVQCGNAARGHTPLLTRGTVRAVALELEIARGR